MRRVDVELNSLDDILSLREFVDVECKPALDRDGKGAVPESFWKTYSVFANTKGGVVLLGAREKKEGFVLEGVPNADKLRNDLLTTANNRKKASFNLLNHQKIQEITIEGKTILRVDVDSAPWRQRPLFLTENPFGNAFFRQGASDCRFSDDAVKRMLGEQTTESLDFRVLPAYELSDLCAETIRAYRQIFTNKKPDHPWNEMNLVGFLRALRAWGRDRENGKEGVTLADLLMFGKIQAIQEVIPNYMLDYREHSSSDGPRWLDRVTSQDGGWSGNLYDFYRQVYPN